LFVIVSSPVLSPGETTVLNLSPDPTAAIAAPKPSFGNRVGGQGAQIAERPCQEFDGSRHRVRDAERTQDGPLANDEVGEADSLLGRVLLARADGRRGPHC
jgi:hypothetical protein